MPRAQFLDRKKNRNSPPTKRVHGLLSVVGGTASLFVLVVGTKVVIIDIYLLAEVLLLTKSIYKYNNKESSTTVN